MRHSLELDGTRQLCNGEWKKHGSFLRKLSPWMEKSAETTCAGSEERLCSSSALISPISYRQANQEGPPQTAQVSSLSNKTLETNRTLERRARESKHLCLVRLG